MGERVIMTIPRKGPVKIEVEGAEGASCTALTERLEAALGGGVVREFKDEYYADHAGQVIGVGSGS